MHTVLVITLFSTIICIKHIIAQVIVKQYEQCTEAIMHLTYMFVWINMII